MYLEHLFSQSCFSLSVFVLNGRWMSGKEGWSAFTVAPRPWHDWKQQTISASAHKVLPAVWPCVQRERNWLNRTGATCSRSTSDALCVTCVELSFLRRWVWNFTCSVLMVKPAKDFRSTSVTFVVPCFPSSLVWTGTKPTSTAPSRDQSLSCATTVGKRTRPRVLCFATGSSSTSVGRSFSASTAQRSFSKDTCGLFTARGIWGRPPTSAKSVARISPASTTWRPTRESTLVKNPISANSVMLLMPKKPAWMSIWGNTSSLVSRILMKEKPYGYYQ